MNLPSPADQEPPADTEAPPAPVPPEDKQQAGDNKAAPSGDTPEPPAVEEVDETEIDETEIDETDIEEEETGNAPVICNHSQNKTLLQLTLDLLSAILKSCIL